LGAGILALDHAPAAGATIMNRRDALSTLGLAVGATAADTVIGAGDEDAAASNAQSSAKSPPQAAAARPVKTADARGCVALVTGSNSGIGLGFVKILLARGAKRVYATARRPETLADVVALDPQRVVPLALDVTIDAQRRAAAEKARDVTWLINNAGIPGSDDMKERRFLKAGSLDDAHQVMDTNFWAQAEMVRAFTPVILANRGGAIVQILSVGALYSVAPYGTYSASKFAARAMIVAVRAELDREPIVAAGVFTGGVNTRLTPAGYTSGVSPEQHANEVLDALARGETDIYAGAGSRQAYEKLRADPQAFERMNVDRWFPPGKAG
jgi:NAD(P)-dependent dehydrogenase (short-subunit alcohol dehydrogenase family)